MGAVAPRMSDEADVNGVVYGMVGDVPVGVVEIEGAGCDGDAWRRTLIRSRGFPMRIPAAPLMYPAQKSADIVKHTEITISQKRRGNMLRGNM